MGSSGVDQRVKSAQRDRIIATEGLLPTTPQGHAMNRTEQHRNKSREQHRDYHPLGLSFYIWHIHACIDAEKVVRYGTLSDYKIYIMDLTERTTPIDVVGSTPSDPHRWGT